MAKNTICLWYDRDAEAAARFYVSVFPNSKIGAITHYGPGTPQPEGTPLTVSFERLPARDPRIGRLRVDLAGRIGVAQRAGRGVRQRGPGAAQLQHRDGDIGQ